MNKKVHDLRELLRPWQSFIFLALVALLFRWYVAAPYIVEGASMEPNFHELNYLIVDKISYTLGKLPERGSVVLLRYPLDPSRTFIKRLIGLPGERVVITGTTVTITPVGGSPFVLPEPYVDERYQKGGLMDITLGAEEYFVMGDNRSASSDSRYWGALPSDHIVGRPILRLFPFKDFSFYPEDGLSFITH